MAERRNRRPHALELPELNGLSFPLTKWLRDPKYRPAPRTGAEDSGLRFLPVEIVAEAKAPMAVPTTGGHIEIELAGGHRMRISGGYDPEALARLIRGLSA